MRRADPLWWPEEGITKGDVLAYYEAVAPVLLPHLRARPFTIKQHYTGPRSPHRWIKDAPDEMPASIPVSPQPARSRGGALVRYPLVEDPAALLWMVGFGAVDLHVWTSRVDRPDRPDVVLFDLDPAGAGGFADVARAALLIRDALAGIGLDAYPMTTGGDGMHVRLPIARRHSYPDVRAFCRAVAGALAGFDRELAGRVVVDCKMNGHGQQVVAPYSVRPRPGAPVAAPLRWDEVDEGLDPAGLGMATVRRRVARDGDLLEPLLRGGQRLPSSS